MRARLVYILPEYRADVDTHMRYNIELLRRAKEVLDIFLVLEKGTLPPDIRGRVLWFRAAPLRACELFLTFSVLRIKGYNIFWTHYSFLGGIIAPFFGKSFYWNCGMPWLYKRGWFEEFIFQKALRRSMLVTGTEGMKKAYCERYALEGNRVLVLANWIDSMRFEEWVGKKEKARDTLGISHEKKVVLFLHRLSKRKGADLIAPIAKEFESDPSVLFLVAGSGPLASTISGSNVRLIGQVSNIDVPMHMAFADVFFMPSEEEGFPHVPLEAMAVGVPFVASDVGGVREIVPQSMSAYVVPQNAEVFAEKIKELLASSALREKLGTEERAWVTRYDIDVVLKEFIKLIVS